MIGKKTDSQRQHGSQITSWKALVFRHFGAPLLLSSAAAFCTSALAGSTVGLYFVDGPDEPIDFLNIPGLPAYNFIQPWQMTGAGTQFVTDGAFQGVTEEQVRAAVIVAVKRKFYSIPTPTGFVLDIEFRAQKVSGPGSVNILLGKHNLTATWFGNSQVGGGLGAEANGESNSAISIDRINSQLQLDFTTFDAAINAIANVTAHEVGHLLALSHVWADVRPDLGWQASDPVVTNPFDVMATAQSGLPEAGWLLDNIFSTVPGTQTGGKSSVDRLIETTGLREFSLRMTVARNGAGYDLSWTSQQAKVYDLVSSTDLATPHGSWEVYDPDGPGGIPPYGDMPPSGSGTNTLTAVPSSDPRRFFAVAEKTVP
jgi:hypothetical protein